MKSDSSGWTPICVGDSIKIDLTPQWLDSLGGRWTVEVSEAEQYIFLFENPRDAVIFALYWA